MQLSWRNVTASAYKRGADPEEGQIQIHQCKRYSVTILCYDVTYQDLFMKAAALLPYKTGASGATARA